MIRTYIKNILGDINELLEEAVDFLKWLIKVLLCCAVIIGISAFILIVMNWTTKIIL